MFWTLNMFRTRLYVLTNTSDWAGLVSLRGPCDVALAAQTSTGFPPTTSRCLTDCCNSLTVRFTADGFLLDRRSLVLLEECEAWTLHRTSPGSHSTGSVQECRLSNNCKCLKRFKIHCDQNKSVDETMRGVKPEERWHPDSDWRKLGPATGSEVSE